MSFSCTFFVPGKPVGKGSKRAFLNPKTGRPIITDMSKGSKDWQNTIRQFAFEHRPDIPIANAVSVQITFMLQLPKSAPKTRPIAPIKRPDTDKLVRVVLDGLTAAGIYADDSQVCIPLKAYKLYIPRDRPSYPQGVIVEVREVGPEECEMFARKHLDARRHLWEGSKDE